MAEELAQIPKPTLPAGGGRIGFKEAMGVQEPFLKRKAELQPQITAAEGDIAKAQQAQQEVLSSGKLEAQQAFGAAEQKAKEELQSKLEAEPLPAFVPTRDTAQDIAGLFGLIGVIGMVVGKGNAMQAMGAMNGMLEGHRKGRADLYKQQLAEFDKNFKSMLQKHSEFRKEMEDAIKLAATNKEEGMQKAELAATKAGSDIVKAQLRKGDLLGAYKLVDESAKGAEKALELESKAREAAVREAAADKRAKLQREQQLQLEQIKFGQKLGTAGTRANIFQRTGKLVPTDKEAEAIGSIADAVDEVSRLREKLKDPEVQTGLISSLAPAIQRISTVTQPLDENQFRNLVDKELTGNDKTTLFIKDAMLAAFKIEQGLVGSRVPVATQRAVGPILDPRAYNKETFDKLLSEREELLYKNAERRNFTKKEIDSLFSEPVTAPEKTEEKITVGDKTYSRPASFTDQQWADYKKAVSAK